MKKNKKYFDDPRYKFMQIKLVDKPTILVEGPDDKMWIKEYFGINKAREINFVVMNNKNRVLWAYENKELFLNTVFLIDSDWENIKSSPPLFSTDCYSMENYAYFKINFLNDFSFNDKNIFKEILCFLYNATMNLYEKNVNKKLKYISEDIHIKNVTEIIDKYKDNLIKTKEYIYENDEQKILKWGRGKTILSLIDIFRTKNDEKSKIAWQKLSRNPLTYNDLNIDVLDNILKFLRL